MLRILKSPEAENDLDEIWLYIAQDNPDCADKLLDEIEETSRKLARFPNMGRNRDELHLGLQSFPIGMYLIFYMPITEIVAAVCNVEKARDFAESGIQVRYADYNVPASWDAALQGADKVLLISSNEIGQRAEQHRSVIDAAKRSGVKLLAYTSVLHAETSPLGLVDEHRETEATLSASGVPFVVLRNGWYAENHTAGIPAALANGGVYGCAGDGRISSAPRAEYAEAAATVLTSNDTQAGRVYELAGDTAYTLSELAAEISRQVGKDIGYVNLQQSEYKDILLKAGLPEVLAELLSDSDTGISRGALFDDSHQLGTLIGRATTPLATTVATALK